MANIGETTTESRYYHEERRERKGTPASVPIALSAFLAETFLLIQNLGFGLFMLLFHSCLDPMSLFNALVFNLHKRNIIFPVKILINEVESAKGRVTSEGVRTDNFAEQHHVLSADEKDAMPRLCEFVPVVYSFDRVLKHEVGCVDTRYP
ncbi:unnamed protein product [Cyclocybe aegerita]|uniref:Uncharacterized protein n=1 Tax=Cyclocybe aegerita TaxID=1973307 RepID=A0A8S0W1J5_CYCAE|nr:unnamed protein product [Cyclocybe aegerita]